MDILTLFVVVFLGAEPQPAGKIPIGKETTYFTGPLDKEGYVDYQAALNQRLSQGITPENNACALLAKVVGPAPEGLELPPEYFKLLGLEPLPTKGVYFVRFIAHVKSLGLAESEYQHALDQLLPSMQRAWTAKDCPHLAGWLAANEQALAVACEAVRRPEYFNPVIRYGPAGQPKSLFRRPGVEVIRDLGRTLAARAMLRVGQGEFVNAWQDLLACHRLGRLVSRGASINEGSIGISIEKMATNADLAYLEANPDGATERLRNLQALPPIPRLVTQVDLGERIFFLDLMQVFSRDKSAAAWNLRLMFGREPSAAELTGLAQVDWGAAMRIGNAWHDKMAAAMQSPSPADRQREYAKEKDTDRDLSSLAGNISKLLTDKNSLGNRAGEAFGAAHCSYYSVVATAVGQDRSEQILRNLHVAFALAAYHHDQRRYPARLDDLAPKYLAKVPSDLFAEKPLVYLPSDKGYLLYSVGVNGKDEQGQGDDGRGDDLNVRMPLPELKGRKK